MNPSQPDYPNSPSGVQHGQQSQISRTVIYVGAPPNQQLYPHTYSPTRVYENYLSTQSIVIGIIIIVSGGLCVLFNSVAIVLNSQLAAIGYGIWGGIMFLITGSFGVSAGILKSRCKVITFMVLCIISSVLGLVMLIVAALSAGADSMAYGRYGSYYNYACNYNQNNNRNPSSSQIDACVAMESMQALLGVIVGIVSIWGAILCCKVACCGYTSGQVSSQPQDVPRQGNQQVYF